MAREPLPPDELAAWGRDAARGTGRSQGALVTTPEHDPSRDSPESRLFAALPGRWTIARTLPGVGEMTGSARFRAAGPDLLHYREDGRLTLHDGPTLEVFREYHYRLEPGRIRICFAEPGPPRTFHVLRMDGPAASDVHLCGQDTYTGHYEFPEEDRFTVRMRVTGPRKDYSIETTYERAG